MFCTNCGKEFPDTEQECPYCGTEKMDIQGLESESWQDQIGEEGQTGTDELEAWKDKLMNLFGKACVVFFL